MQLLTPAGVGGRGPQLGAIRTTHKDYLAYIQQSFRATLNGDRTDFYRNSYRILKKK